MIRLNMAIVALALALSPPAWSQTPFTGGQQKPVSTTPPPKSQPPAQGAGQPAGSGASQSGQAPVGASGQPAAKMPAVVPPASRLPMSKDMREQAEYQAEGVFPDMTRPGAGGQVQDAWNNSEPGKGVHVQRLCEDCVYKVRTREFMTTTVVLPEDAVITSVDPGDGVGFVTKIKTSNKLSVRPTSWGMDTNLNVHTKSGAVYPLYVRSETVNSMNIPDLVVKIVGREKPVDVEGHAADSGRAAEPLAKPGDRVVPPGKRDFVRHVPLDVAKFHGWNDYRLWGDDDLRPEMIWRDDIFTYIRYGKKWDGMELSAGYVTIDGIDELVNTHVEGTVFVIESVAPLITLKNGKQYLCIRYNGKRP